MILMLYKKIGLYSTVFIDKLEIIMHRNRQLYSVKFPFIAFETNNETLVLLSFILGIVFEILYGLLVICGFFASYNWLIMGILPDIFGWLCIVLFITAIISTNNGNDDAN